MSKLFLAAAASLLCIGAACAQTSPVKVTDVWARATPAKAETGAAYFTMQAATPDRLAGVSTPVARKAELHEMSMQGNIMKMRQIAGVDLPAGQPVTLKPGGIHVMMLGLKRPLKPGEHFPLTLEFAKGGEQQVNATVEGIGAMGPNAQSSAPAAMPMPMPAHH